jgi:hypothetical protein
MRGSTGQLLPVVGGGNRHDRGLDLLYCRPDRYWAIHHLRPQTRAQVHRDWKFYCTTSVRPHHVNVPGDKPNYMHLNTSMADNELPELIRQFPVSGFSLYERSTLSDFLSYTID